MVLACNMELEGHSKALVLVEGNELLEGHSKVLVLVYSNDLALAYVLGSK